MKRATLTIVIGLICASLFSQVDTAMTDTTRSVYQGLKTLKFYDANFSYVYKAGRRSYEVNNKRVSKGDYDKYHSPWKNMEVCKPCILEAYDTKDILIRKSIQYTDCPVGFLIDYFPNGKVKVIGHYKENESDDWNDLWDRGFCRKDGVFTYFNDKGQKLYNEAWKDGQFIKQFPEQKKTELWTITLTLDGEKIGKQPLTPQQVSELSITPQFKNSSREGTDLTIIFEISAAGHKPASGTFTLDNFNTIDVQKMLDGIGVKSSDKFSCTLLVLNNGVNVFRYGLTIKP